MNGFKFASLLALSGLLLVPASAQFIGDRSTLNSILVGGGTLDNFETYNVGNNFAENLDVWELDSMTIANGQGPGLVNMGAMYMDPSQRQLQWNGDAYFGLTSKTLLANGEGGMIHMHFENFTQAFGVDLKNFEGFGYNAVVNVYNGSALVGTGNVSLSGGGGESSFFGWQNLGGITRVEIMSADYSWSPIIDDHQYGVVPEPATMIALAGALGALAARRRRKN